MPEPSQYLRHDLRIVYCADGLGVAEMGAVGVVVWRDDVSRSRFERQKAGLAEVLSRHPEGIGFMCVIEPTSAPPDDELRRASRKMVEAFGSSLKCVACVVEGSGFRAALTRSILTGMALLNSKRIAPTATFARLDEGAQWMSEFVPIESINDFVAAVESVRSRLTVI